MLLEPHRGCEVDASFVLLLKADVWRLLVQSDAKSLQLVFDQLLVAQGLQHIEHNQEQVASSSHWKRKAGAAGTGCKIEGMISRKRGDAFEVRPSNIQLMTAISTCDDLSASAFSILGSLNDSREIKKLGGKTRDEERRK